MDSDWFAGFTDGEGCFWFRTFHEEGHVPCFSIGLRADDLAVLESLHAEFGGAIHVTNPPSIRQNMPNAKPRAMWTVIAKSDLAGLVRYFDGHPLHAKKARDYAIWRRGVTAYLRGGRSDPELHTLREALTAGRVYDAEPLDEVAESPQLRLVS